MRGCSYVVLAFLILWFICSLAVSLGVYALWNIVIVWLFAVPALTFVKSWVVGLVIGLIVALIKG